MLQFFQENILIGSTRRGLRNKQERCVVSIPNNSVVQSVKNRWSSHVVNMHSFARLRLRAGLFIRVLKGQQLSRAISTPAHICHQLSFVRELP